MPPQNFNELFKFYTSYVKLLYSFIQISNPLPNEVMFELNAAFDHISRKWTYGESEPQVVKKAYSHLKRACLDIFKIQVKEATKQYNELREIDTSVIDNGNFDKELIKLYHEIKHEAKMARANEGDKRYDNDDRVLAFDMWQPVFDKCIRLEQEFYLHKAIEWAKKKEKNNNRAFTFKNLLLSILASFIAGLITKDILVEMFNYIISIFN